MTSGRQGPRRSPGDGRAPRRPGQGGRGVPAPRGHRLDLHRVSGASLRAVAAGEAGPADLALLRAGQRSHLLLVLRALLDRADDLPGPQRRGGPSALSVWGVLTAAEERDAGAVDAVLDDPSVRAWAVRLLRRVGGGSGAAPGAAAPLWADLGQFRALAAAAALRAGTEVSLRVPAYRGLVWVPGGGGAGPVSGRRWSEAEFHVAGGGAVVRGECAEVRLPGARTLAEPAAGWRPLVALCGPRDVPREPCADPHSAAAGPGGPGRGDGGPGEGLRLDAVTPYRDFDVSPRAPLRLGERRTRLWRERLRGACALLARESPPDAAALGALVRVLVPRPFPASPGGLVPSASSPEAFGAVALSLPYDEPQTAAVLVHETRHQELTALMSLVPLVRGPEAGAAEAGERLYYAPWRGDPRPARGVLHGVYAFAGVARFWRAHRDAAEGAGARRADFEFAVFREQVGEAVAALAEGGDLTEAGRLFVEEVAAPLERWRKEEVPAEPARLAAHYCAVRRALWRWRHLAVDEAFVARLAGDWAAGRPAPPLPAPVLAPSEEAHRSPAFGTLARLSLSAPATFTRRLRRAGAEGDAAAAAECAAVAGDAQAAARWYGVRVAADPWDAEAWIGAALVRRRGSAAAALLLDRPETVFAVHRAVVAAGVRPADPPDIAGWLAGGARA